MASFKLAQIILLIFLLPITIHAQEIKNLTIINGSYGGGWELTAKLTGQNLVDLNLVKSFNIETLEGGAGWRALKMFVTDDKYKNDILVQSEPLISGYLKNMYGKGFRDLRPIALMAAEYSCIVVAYDSKYKTLDDILIALDSNAAKVPISLGGRPGAGDHITANMIFKAANVNNPANLRYTFSDGGDNATINYLIKTKNIIGVTGYNSIITQAVTEQKIRVIGVTSATSIDGHPPLRDLGIDIEYANWRGYFARKDIEEEKFQAYITVLKALSNSKQWHTILHKNGWSPFYKSGSDLDAFLLQHEDNLKMTMQELNIIK